MASVLRHLSPEGDTELSWDPTSPVETEVARKAFSGLRTKGYLAYRLNDEGEHHGEQIREFDPLARAIVMVPPLQGG